MVALALLALIGADTIALKDKAIVSGRWVRALDLVDAERSDAAARLRLADIYLGRAPRTGRPGPLRSTRSVASWNAAASIPPPSPGSATAWTWPQACPPRRSPCAARSPPRSSASCRPRRRCASSSCSPKPCPEGMVVSDVKPRGTGYVATLSNGTKVDVVAKVLRPRDAVFAVRDLLPGRTIDRADLEIKRIEMSDDDRGTELGLIVGAVPAVRIRPGAPIAASDLRVKAVVKKGDVVRAVSTGYEVDARALEDGATGQDISLEFVSSRNRLRAKVASASRVDVVESAR